MIEDEPLHHQRDPLDPAPTRKGIESTNFQAVPMILPGSSRTPVVVQVRPSDLTALGVPASQCARQGRVGFQPAHSGRAPLGSTIEDSTFLKHSTSRPVRPNTRRPTISRFTITFDHASPNTAIITAEP